MKKRFTVYAIVYLLIVGMIGVIKGGEQVGDDSGAPESAIQTQDSGHEQSFSDPKYTCGDADGSGSVGVNDAIRVFNYAVGIGAAPEEDVLSGNADGQLGVNVADAYYISVYIYAMGPAPANCTNTSGSLSILAGDSIIVGGPPYNEYPGGDSVEIPIYITSSANLGGFTIGFSYTSTADNEITSVNLTGSAQPSITSNPDTLNNTVIVGWWDFMAMSPMAPQSHTLLCKLNARTPIGKGTVAITIDSATVGPAGTWMTATTAGGGINPHFLIEQNINYTVVPIDSADVYYVKSADMDRDNYMDLIYTGAADSGLYVAYGDATDTLETPISYLNIAQAAINIDYINGDTLLDIAAIDASSLYILLNDGNRTFTSSSVPLSAIKSDFYYEAGVFRGRGNSPGIASGFFDDDWDIDLAVTPNTILYGNGEGNFTSSTTLDFNFETVNVADFDYDGSDDLLVTSGDSIKIYVNAGSGVFNQTGAVEIGTPLFEVPPTNAITDLNRDRNWDFVEVVPISSTTDSSLVIVGLGDGAGDTLQTSSFFIDGLAYGVLASDINRDVSMDIILANGTYQRLEIYYGDGTGSFAEPEYIELDAGTDITFALASLDLDRDGNPDFATGGPEGDNLIVAIDEQAGTTESLDEMVVTGYTSVTLEIINPAGHVNSQNFQTIAGADYWRNDVNDDGALDEESYDYNLQFGEYTIVIRSRPGDPGLNFDIGVRVNGTVRATTHLNYAQPKGGGFREDSLVFYYMVETESSIRPGNGIPTSSLPVFDWSGLMEGGGMVDSFQFQLDRFMDFSAPIYDVNGLTEPSWMPSVKLGVDSVFYWHFRSFNSGIPSEYSRTFAAYIAYEICGDANGDDDVNVSDAVSIINYVFVGGNPPDPLIAADVNCDANVNVSDAVWIINYVFVGGNNPCDSDGDGKPDC
jgi:hypothetical protein